MIRAIEKEDIKDLKEVLDHCNLFPSEFLDQMIASYLTDPESEDLWFTYENKSKPIAIAYCAPMEFTNGTYNLYAIGIHDEFQHRGIGTQMMTYIEDLLIKSGQRVLIVETSSSAEQEAARNFYDKCGYSREAIIRDFWDEGEDKLVFWKKL